MKIIIHQTHHTINDFSEIYDYLNRAVHHEKESKSIRIHIFPELFLAGYPLQDLVLEKSFIEKYHNLLSDIKILFKKLPDNIFFLIGGLDYLTSIDSNNSKQNLIKNALYLASNKEFRACYYKRLLPYYDIFDEKKYYTAGEDQVVLELNNKKVGLLICEDMWPSHYHNENPIEDLYKKCQQENIKLDLVINASASPFYIGKEDQRISRGINISKKFQAPFVYVNKVGAEDEIIFDGESFVAIDEKIIKSKLFQKDILEVDLLDKDKIQKQIAKPPYAPEKQALLLNAIIFGLQDYAHKNNFKKFLVALSGGMDSALVLTIARLGLKSDQTIEAIYMPSIYSETLSYDLSVKLCKKLQVPLKVFPIKFLHSTIRSSFKDTFNEPLENLADENLQSRLRGTLLYARANQQNACVINTSNKSEIAVGYSTLYGDSVGALSVIGDVYKTEVFELANYINSKFSNLIPEEIITRAPSAELRENQKDSDSLPPYERLDPLLEALLAETSQLSLQDIIDSKKYGSEEEIKKVKRLIETSEFKRKQFPPILKLKQKSFGFGYRMPISKKRS